MQATQTLTRNICVCLMVCFCKRKCVRLEDCLLKPQSELRKEFMFSGNSWSVYSGSFSKKNYTLHFSDSSIGVRTVEWRLHSASSKQRRYKQALKAFKHHSVWWLNHWFGRVGDRGTENTPLPSSRRKPTPHFSLADLSVIHTDVFLRGIRDQDHDLSRRHGEPTFCAFQDSSHEIFSKIFGVKSACSCPEHFSDCLN